MSMKFSVYNQDGTKPNLEEIVRTEEWAKDLMLHDLDGFAIMEDGYIVLLDECGRFRSAPPNRFVVKWGDK